MIVAGHIKSALGKSISSVLYKDGWHGAEEQPPCHPSRDWGDKRSTRWPPLELLLNSSRLDHFMLSAQVRSSMLTQERNRQVNRIGNDWCRRFRSIHQRGSYCRTPRRYSQVIVSFAMDHQDMDSLSPALCAGFAGCGTSPKRPRLRSESFEMSNKIAQVSLDFSGAARMCAGSKGVDADGPAVS